MLPISTTAIEEKNKLAGGSAFLVALEIIIPGLADPVRIIQNSEDVVWKGETWQAFPFEIDELTDQSGSEVPTVAIKVSNVSRSMEVYLEYYDAYVKSYGYTPITVHIYVINAKVIAEDSNAEPEVEHIFDLKKPSADAMWATFRLSAMNPYMRRFPLGMILRNHCRYKFKSARCGYEGAAITCNHTLAACRSYGNSERFGNAPGAGKGGFEVY